MKQAPTPGTGKYEQLLERCRSLSPVPTAVAHPCEASALAGAVEAAQKKLIVPILVGPIGKIREIAKSAGVDLTGALPCLSVSSASDWMALRISRNCVRLLVPRALTICAHCR